MAKAPTREELKAFAAEAAKGIKTQDDLNKFAADLLKITVESALNAELDHHLGYSKHSPNGKNTGNSRNGFSSKTLKGNHGQIELDTPRDRNGTFEPQLIPKGQACFADWSQLAVLAYLERQDTFGRLGVSGHPIQYYRCLKVSRKLSAKRHPQSVSIPGPSLWVGNGAPLACSKKDQKYLANSVPILRNFNVYPQAADPAIPFASTMPFTNPPELSTTDQ